MDVAGAEDVCDVDGNGADRGDGLVAREIVHTISAVHVDFDPAKNAGNVATRGLSFASAADFDFETAIVAVDGRVDYGETRYVAVGYLDRRLHVLCFLETEHGVRVISFRKANAREVRRYEQATTADR